VREVVVRGRDYHPNHQIDEADDSGSHAGTTPSGHAVAWARCDRRKPTSTTAATGPPRGRSRHHGDCARSLFPVDLVLQVLERVLRLVDG
jgi:hypothetical protein